MDSFNFQMSYLLPRRDDPIRRNENENRFTDCLNQAGGNFINWVITKPQYSIPLCIGLIIGIPSLIGITAAAAMSQRNISLVETTTPYTTLATTPETAASNIYYLENKRDKSIKQVGMAQTNEVSYIYSKIDLPAAYKCKFSSELLKNGFYKWNLNSYPDVSKSGSQVINSGNSRKDKHVEFQKESVKVTDINKPPNGFSEPIEECNMDINKDLLNKYRKS